MQTLDTEGLECPDPLRMLHSAMFFLSKGDVLVMVATDVSTLRDVRRFCQFLQHDLLSINKVMVGYKPYLYFRIMKGC